MVPNCGVGKGTDPDQLSSVLNKAKLFQSYIAGHSAHNLNTQYSAPKTFGAAHEWMLGVGF
jgi:hypothetical protein